MTPKNKQRNNRRRRNRGSRNVRTKSSNVTINSVMVGRSVVRSAIPMVVANQVFSKKFRYVFSDAEQKGGHIVSPLCLLNAMWYATGTTSGQRLFNSVRLNQVRLYTTQPNVTIEFEWLGFNSRQEGLSATASDAQPAEIVVSPGANQQAGWWWNQSSAPEEACLQPIFAVSTDTAESAFVEVYLSFTMQDQDAATPTTNTLVTTGATLGRMYTNALDNTDVVGTGFGELKLVPYGYGSVLSAHGM